MSSAARRRRRQQPPGEPVRRRRAGAHGRRRDAPGRRARPRRRVPPAAARLGGVHAAAPGRPRHQPEGARRARLRPRAGDQLHRRAARVVRAWARSSSPTTSSCSARCPACSTTNADTASPASTPGGAAEVLDTWHAATEVPLHDGGVYWQVTGPRLETVAEIRVFAQHADVVGMTMASECTVAGELGLRVRVGVRGRQPRQRRGGAPAHVERVRGRSRRVATGAGEGPRRAGAGPRRLTGARQSS